MNDLRNAQASRCFGSVAEVNGSPPTAFAPWFFGGTDGMTYVVKLARSGDRTAFNELFFGAMGQLLNLPIPEVVTIDVPEVLTQLDPKLRAAHFPAGRHLGIRRLPDGSFNLWNQKIPPIANEHQLPAICMYCSWIVDRDHSDNDGNWMLVPDGDTFQAWAIDFGYVLDGPSWTPQTLDLIRDRVVAFSPNRIAELACADSASFGNPMKGIASLDWAAMIAMSAKIPENWDGRHDCDSVMNFLKARLAGLATAYGVNL